MRARLLFLIGIVAASTALPSQAQDAKPDGWALLRQHGEFNNLSAEFERIFVFTYTQGKLSLDRGKWGIPSVRPAFPGIVGVANQFSTPLESHFSEVMSKSQARSVSTSTGGDRRFIKFQGSKLNGELTLQTSRRVFHVQEAVAPRRTLTLTDSGDQFEIQIACPDGPTLWIKQKSDGVFSTSFAHQFQKTENQAKSLKEYYRTHRGELAERLGPTLEPLGIHILPSPDTPTVRRAVLSDLCRKPNDAKEAERLIKQLDDDDYMVREKARKSLFEGYFRYREMIHKTIATPTVSLETSRRLTAIRDRFTDVGRAHELAQLLDLATDVTYLISLMETASTEEIPALIRHLETTTGQNHGRDVSAWKTWNQTQRKTENLK